MRQAKPVVIVLNTYLYFMCMCPHLCMCTTCVPRACGDQTTSSVLLESELQMFAMWVPGTKLGAVKH